MKTYKNCQSCGMPKKMDDGNGGTEKDGSKSDKYCSYWNGANLSPFSLYKSGSKACLK